MKITEKQRKRLTEQLGECQHKPEVKGGYYRSGSYGNPAQEFYVEEYKQCKLCGSCNLKQRTFDNWNDFGAVVKKLLTTKTDAFDLSEFFEGKYHIRLLQVVNKA